MGMGINLHIWDFSLNFNTKKNYDPMQIIELH